MKRKKKKCITNKRGEEVEMLGKMRKHGMFR